MSLTIDQQRQRVEHEITRMVDDLDKSAMRKMQVNRQVSSGFANSCELADWFANDESDQQPFPLATDPHFMRNNRSGPITIWKSISQRRPIIARHQKKFTKTHFVRFTHHPRNTQKEMHLCAAKCCDDSNASMDVVQGCIDRCSQPVNRAQQYVQKELGDYQGRLQRCVMVIMIIWHLAKPTDFSCACARIQTLSAMQRWH